MIDLKAYAALILRKDELLAAVDRLDDESDAVWRRLTDLGRDDARGVASDVCWARRGGKPPPRGRRPEDVQPCELDGLREAAAGADPLLTLRLVRACQTALTVRAAAVLRAGAYRALGMDDVAALFDGLAGEGKADG